VVISAIDGMAGIGKTALAVHWAHRVAHRYPDGQLYLNLRGFDPAGTPVPPGEAVRGFLHALGVPADRIPDGLDAQTGLYRSLLTGRRMLVLLDNALDADQVGPLLPGSPGCLAVVTSRNQLTSLVCAQEAHCLTLDPLSPPDARALLTGRLGQDRIATRSGRGGRDHRPMCPAATGPEHRRRPGRGTPGLDPRRGRRAAAREPAVADRLQQRRSEHRRTVGVLLVLPDT
jgi:hypothetical protein